MPIVDVVGERLDRGERRTRLLGLQGDRGPTGPEELDRLVDVPRTSGAWPASSHGNCKTALAVGYCFYFNAALGRKNAAESTPVGRASARRVGSAPAESGRWNASQLGRVRAVTRSGPVGKMTRPAAIHPTDHEPARVVVVTGCGQGIGREVLNRAIADGYVVVGVEVDPGLVASLNSKLAGPSLALTADVADPEALEWAVERAATIGELHGWVNNAGITRRTNLHDPDKASVRRVLDVNLLGCYWGCAAAVQQFVRQRSGGVVVNVSSVHARAAYGDHSAYDVSKAGIEALTRYLAVEYGRLNIRANAVAPGGVATPGATTGKLASELAAIGRAHPLGRIAEPSEIAGVVSFLLSPDAAFVTGHTLVVDGGLTARCWDFELDPRLAAIYGLDATSLDKERFGVDGESAGSLRETSERTTQ